MKTEFKNYDSRFVFENTGWLYEPENKEIREHLIIGLNKISNLADDFIWELKAHSLNIQGFDRYLESQVDESHIVFIKYYRETTEDDIIDKMLIITFDDDLDLEIKSVDYCGNTEVVYEWLC